jgi:hypothetical protein
MPAEINYKRKYLELRSKYIADLDVAFRLGFEAGGQQTQQQQAMDAQQQNQQMEHQQSLGHSGPMDQGMNQEQHQRSNPENPTGSELDQHISKLESMLGNGESKPENVEEVKKSLEAILTLRKAEKFAAEMKKSEQAISGIVKAIHKPAFKLGIQAQHNMSDNAKKAVSLQHKIVDDIFKSWKEEEKKASNNIFNVLNIENLTDKE